MVTMQERITGWDHFVERATLALADDSLDATMKRGMVLFAAGLYGVTWAEAEEWMGTT